MKRHKSQKCSIYAAKQKVFSSLTNEDPPMVVWVFFFTSECFLQPATLISGSCASYTDAVKCVPPKVRKGQMQFLEQIGSCPVPTKQLSCHVWDPQSEWHSKRLKIRKHACVSTLCDRVTRWGLSGSRPLGQTHLYWQVVFSQGCQHATWLVTSLDKDQT